MFFLRFSDSIDSDFFLFENKTEYSHHEIIFIKEIFDHCIDQVSVISVYVDYIKSRKEKSDEKMVVVCWLVVVCVWCVYGFVFVFS